MFLINTTNIEKAYTVMKTNFYVYIGSYLLLLVVGVVFGMGGGVWDWRGCLSCSEGVFGIGGGVWNRRGGLKN